MHLTALWGYGVSQPIFAMLQGNPEFLVINGASRLEAVTFAVLLAFGPPVAAVAIEQALGTVSHRVAAVVHILFLWLFGFTALLQVLRLAEPASRATILIPAVAAYVAAIAYAKWPPLRTFLSVSVVLPIVAFLAFVATAPLALADTKGDELAIDAETPVVLIVFDEFPVTSLMRGDGSLDAARFPGFGRLASDGVWYSRATSVHEYTTHAVPAILTGKRPPSVALPTLADHPHNLFTLLGESYAFQVREPVTRLCPVRYCPQHRSARRLPSRVRGLLGDVSVNYLHRSLPDDFRGTIAPLREGWGVLVDNTARSEMEFVGTVRRSNPARTLYFLHTMKPHSPWAVLPSGRAYGGRYFVSGLADDWKPGKLERWRDGQPLLVAQGLQRHLLEVGDVDRVVRALIDKLDATGLYERALIVVTADHGISFRPGGWKRHATSANIADIAAVPLFVKYPRQKAGREDRRAAMSIDVLPTIADVLGIELPWKVDGQSLLDPARTRTVRIARRDGVPVVSPVRRVTAEVLRTARRNARWFGEGRDSMYRLGGMPDLIGRATTELPRSVAEDARLTLAREAELTQVQKASGYVPAHLVGRVAWDALEPDERLAIAVNGRIAAITRPFHSRGRTYFSALVDEAVLRDGPNTLEVFAARGKGSHLRLVLLGGTAKQEK